MAERSHNHVGRGAKGRPDRPGLIKPACGVHCGPQYSILTSIGRNGAGDALEHRWKSREDRQNYYGRWRLLLVGPELKIEFLD